MLERAAADRDHRQRRRLPARRQQHGYTSSKAAANRYGETLATSSSRHAGAVF
jgi:hypothetical protein